MDYLKLIWEFVNSPAGITLAASLVLYVLNKAYSAKPAWKKFEGTIISAIRLAEKAIPDTVDNKGIKRFDEALKHVLRVYKEVEGKRPSDKVEAELKEGISIIHDSIL